MVLGALRGRFVVVIVLGLITGAAAGVAGWKFTKPKYESEGLVSIRYSLPEVMAETDQNRPMPMYETFMQSQRLLITSRAVMDAAITDSIWKTMGRTVPLEPDRYFAKNLKVDVKPRSEYIQIAVQDEDPATAAAAVNSIINAYTERYKTEEGRLTKERMGVLEQKEKTASQEVVTAVSALDVATHELGPANLMYDASVERWRKAEGTLADIKVMIENVRARDEDVRLKSLEKGANGLAQIPSPSTQPMFTAAELAMTDGTLHRLLDEQDKLEVELKRLRLRFGEEHNAVKNTKMNLDEATRRVEDHLRICATLMARGGDGNRYTPQSSDALRRSETIIAKVKDDALKDMQTYGERRSRLEKLNGDVAGKRLELEKIQQRLGMFKNEGLGGGRLSVVGTGEIPLSPARDLRPQISAVAGLGGALIPAGMLVLASFVTSRRYRYSDEANSHSPVRGQLLGILPTLKSVEDAEAMASSAHSVHQIRVSLRAQAQNEISNAYLVTSSAAGDGKTSLTMSLGYSFAASRARTLVIDCDLVGRHLSRNLDVSDTDGFNEALKSQQLRNLVRKVGPELYVMSAGRAADFDACGISTATVRSIIAEAKRYFEVILIDSGPILGSVEAAVLAQVVDGVIFAIARGQERSLVERSVRRVNALGARVEGFVFNRAESGDFLRSAYSSSSRLTAPAVGGPSRRIFNPESNRMAAFGPIVQAMIASVPTEFQEAQ
jgi:succinoglycan biosynthesis transport protein ExoP